MLKNYGDSRKIVGKTGNVVYKAKKRGQILTFDRKCPLLPPIKNGDHPEIIRMGTQLERVINNIFIFGIDYGNPLNAFDMNIKI